jgi:hypothetical protein
LRGARLDSRQRAGADPAVRDLYWKPWDAPGCEHVRVSLDTRRAAAKSAVVADGLVLLYRDGQTLRCHYRLTADAGWRARSLDLAVRWGGRRLRESALRLAGDGKGRWRVDGVRAPDLDDCLDLDIQLTPFTNSLPIRRLDLAAGEIADIRAVYVPLPDLEPVPAEQSYICLRPLGLSGGLYRYESRTSSFGTDLPVDSGGFVVDYPDSFRRIW